MKKVKLSENFSLEEANFITNAISGPGQIFKDFYVRAYRDGKELIGSAATGKAPRKFTDFAAAKKYAKAISTNIDGKVVVKSGKEFKKPEYEKLNLSVGGTPMINHQIVSYSSGTENPGSDFTGLFTDAFRSATKAVKLSAPSKRAGKETEAEPDDRYESTKPIETADRAAISSTAEKTQSADIPSENKDNYTDDAADSKYNPKFEPKDDPEQQEIGKEVDKPDKPDKSTPAEAQPTAEPGPKKPDPADPMSAVVELARKSSGAIVININNGVVNNTNKETNTTTNTIVNGTGNVVDQSKNDNSQKFTQDNSSGDRNTATVNNSGIMQTTIQNNVDLEQAILEIMSSHKSTKSKATDLRSLLKGISIVPAATNPTLTEAYNLINNCEDTSVNDMTFEELNDNFEQSLRTPGVYGVEIVGEDCTLFPTEVEARDYFDSLSLDDFSPDCEGIQLFIVTDTAGSTEVIDNKSVHDDLSDEEFLEAFGAALKDKHDQECTNCSGANFNDDDTPKFGDFKPGDDFNAFDDFDIEKQSDEIIPDEWDELWREEDTVLMEEFEETSATKVDTENLGTFDKAKEGPLWKVCDALNTSGKIIIKSTEQLQKIANYIPIYQKTAADGTRLDTIKNSGKLFNSDGSVKQIKADPTADGRYTVTLTEAFGKKKTYYCVVGQEMGTSNPGKKVYLTNESESAAKETFSTICKKVHANPNTYINKGSAYCIKLLQADNEEFNNAKEVNSECVNSLREDHSRIQNAVKPLHYDASELGKNLPPYNPDVEGFLWDNCSFLESDGSTIVAYPEQAEAVIDYIPVYLVTDSTGQRYSNLVVTRKAAKSKFDKPKRSKLVDAEGKVHRDWFEVKELGYKEYEITLKPKK